MGFNSEFKGFKMFALFHRQCAEIICLDVAEFSLRLTQFYEQWNVVINIFDTASNPSVFRRICFSSRFRFLHQVTGYTMES